MRRLALIALLVAGQAVGVLTQAPPAVTSASLTSATCPGTGCTALNVSSYASVALQVSGTWSGTVIFEGSVDGTNYQALTVTPTNSTTTTSTTTANGVWTGSVGGLSRVRARVSSYSSGTAVVTLQAALSGGGSGGGGGGASASTIGAAVPASAIAVAARDNSGNLAYFQFDGSGNLLTAVTGAGSGGTSSADRSTYTAGTTAGTPGMVAHDDASPGTLAEDKVGLVRGSALREMYTQLRDAAGNDRGANVSAGGALIVDGSAATQPVSVASLPSHAVTNAGTFAVQAAQSGTWNITNVSGTVSLPTGAATETTVAAINTVFGAKADAKSTATDTTAISAMSVLKQISASVQAPPSSEVTNTGLFTTQAEQAGFWDITNITGTITLPTGASTEAKQDTGNTSIAAVNTVLGAKTDAKSTATDTTSISAMSVWKQMSASLQAPPSRAVTNAGTFAVQNTQQGTASQNVAQINGVTVLMGAGNTGTGSQRVTIASDQAVILVKHATGTPILANALSTTPATVTGSAGVLDSYFCYNPNATVAYVQIFDISGSVTLGTSVPKWSIAIPATSAGNLSQMAMAFANAIKVAATTTATGMTAPSSALDCNFTYR